MAPPNQQLRSLSEALDGLNDCQRRAFLELAGENNVFLTGGAGTGKTYVIHKYIEYMRSRGKRIPVVASTGAAAILAGGQTFHRFFTLSVATDIDALVERALEKPFIHQRLKNIDTIILDEISMLPGYVFEAAYRIAQRVKGNSKPWGGIKIIVVGDFRQLPPVSKRWEDTPWTFLTDAWRESDFTPALLMTPVRSVDPHFVKLLGHARAGVCTPEIAKFLDSKTVGSDAPDDFPRLFGRKMDVDGYNEEMLDKLPGEETLFETKYQGIERYIEDLKKDAPIPPVLALKPGALVMLRQNDVDDRYVNGSLGHVVSINTPKSASAGRMTLKDIMGPTVTVKLLSGADVEVAPGVFMYNNDKGEVYATAENYPMSLAWATTIHKSQGATMDKVLLDLTQLWEPGQLYVALSRVRSPDGVKIVKWDKRAFKTDQQVTDFHKEMLKQVRSL